MKPQPRQSRWQENDSSHRERSVQQIRQVTIIGAGMMGQEIAADFMLQGTINSIVDAVDGEQARFYQIDLTLIELGSNKKVWVGQKKIKKTIEKSGFRL